MIKNSNHFKKCWIFTFFKTAINLDHAPFTFGKNIDKYFFSFLKVKCHLYYLKKSFCIFLKLLFSPTVLIIFDQLIFWIFPYKIKKYSCHYAGNYLYYFEYYFCNVRSIKNCFEFEKAHMWAKPNAIFIKITKICSCVVFLVIFCLSKIR